MKFEDALKAMREGKKVTRKDWALVLGTPEYYCVLNGKFVFYSGIEYYESCISISGKDILAEDWEVVEDDNI